MKGWRMEDREWSQEPGACRMWHVAWSIECAKCEVHMIACSLLPVAYKPFSTRAVRLEIGGATPGNQPPTCSRTNGCSSRYAHTEPRALSASQRDARDTRRPREWRAARGALVLAAGAASASAATPASSAAEGFAFLKYQISIIKYQKSKIRNPKAKPKAPYPEPKLHSKHQTPNFKVQDFKLQGCRLQAPASGFHLQASASEMYHAYMYNV